MGDDARSRNVYRCIPTAKRRPAPGEVGTMRQQLAAVSAFLDIQADDYQTGFARERRWTVVHALATDSPIPITYGEGPR